MMQISNRVFFGGRMNLKIFFCGLLCCFAATKSFGENSNTVAVLDFTREAAAVADGRTAGLEDFFEVALEKRDVPVLERRNLRLVLAERARRDTGLLTADSLSQAKLPALNFFISGSVAFPSANEFALTISAVRADKATVEAAFTRRGFYPDDWLPAIESLAGEVDARLQLPKRPRTERSEFEKLTWLPEAALPFFKGLDYYARGDYAAAVPWFREAYGKDRHFDIARRWESRAYAKLGLLQLAGAPSLNGTNTVASGRSSKREVMALVASKKISAASRAAFLEALARNDEFDLFDPGSIGATADEIDLQLTGQMASSLDERGVWLVVDSLVYLDAPDARTFTVRQQSLLSGEMIRQEKFNAANAPDFKKFAAEFLKSRKANVPAEAETKNPPALLEPLRTEPGTTALPQALRLAQAEPEAARRWVALADYFGDYQFKGICLDEAVRAVERQRGQPDAAHWLASALWRKREMSRRIFYEPTARYRAPNPITNDFARLLEWFPKSAEAASLVEVTNRGEGSYTVVGPADRRYLNAVYTNLFQPALRSTLLPPPKNNSPAADFSDARLINRLQEFLKQERNAPAWQLANDLKRFGDEATRARVKPMLDALVQTAVREREQFAEFNASVAADNAGKILELGKELARSIDRRDRVVVIEQCAGLIKKREGANGQLKYLFAQARQYRADFLINPATSQFGNELEYQLLEGSDLIQPVRGAVDYGYEPLMNRVVDIAHELPTAELAREIFEQLRDDETLPPAKRFTATFDLAVGEQARGNSFEAMTQLKELLRQTEGSGLPLIRHGSWSQSIESAAFEALRKMRIYSGVEADICECCGKISNEPPSRPANFDEVNRKLEQLWRQQIGEAGTNLPSVKEQLLADKENFFPAILYKLRTGQEISHTLIFCSDLGTNSLPALPVILTIIRRGEPFQDYNNALSAVGSLGRAAACARPLLILARANADNGNFNYALERIGPAPRRVMPQLAQLLDHQNPEVCRRAGEAMMQTAKSELEPFSKLSAVEQVTRLRQWWESDGQKIAWQ